MKLLKNDAGNKIAWQGVLLSVQPRPMGSKIAFGLDRTPDSLLTPIQCQFMQLLKSRAQIKFLVGTAVRHQLEAMRRALRSVHQTGASPLFQVAIALGAVAALTRTRLVWFVSMLVGLIGAGLFLVTIL